MTNLEYYSFDNLEFKLYDVDGLNTYPLREDHLQQYLNEDVANILLAIKYIPKHSKDDITIFTRCVKLQKGDNVLKHLNSAKIKWLLQEYQPNHLTRDELINSDIMHFPRHAKVAKRQFCFEG